MLVQSRDITGKVRITETVPCQCVGYLSRGETYAVTVIGVKIVGVVQ
jgi:hypothetical protein